MALVVLRILCDYAPRQEDVSQNGVKAPYILNLRNRWQWLSASRFDNWNAVPTIQEAPWAPQPTWTDWKNGQILLGGNRSPILQPVGSLEYWQCNSWVFWHIYKKYAAVLLFVTYCGVSCSVTGGFMTGSRWKQWYWSRVFSKCLPVSVTNHHFTVAAYTSISAPWKM